MTHCGLSGEYASGMPVPVRRWWMDRWAKEQEEIERRRKALGQGG